MRARMLTMAVAITLVSACGRPTQATDAEDLLTGARLYAANGCGTCHGREGRGDGPLASTLSPPARDFRDPNAFKNGSDPTSIATTLATGLTRDGGQMQSYFHLSDRERFLIARYVVSLRTAPVSSSPGASHD
ncbi:MAG: cytochrome c [Acidobacteria bacterium]|nr:cytochrome c [Acidobacteriota bacterium]